MGLLLIITAVCFVVWIFFFIDKKKPDNSVHSSSFYWPDKTETDRHMERISYQTNATYMNNLIKQIKGDKDAN